MSNESEIAADMAQSVKVTKHRSPNYPAISLKDALNKASQLLGKYKRAEVPINLAQELWGYKPHGGMGNQTVAALKAYGFLDVEGDGKARKVKVSDTAFRVLLKSPDRAKLLKDAAIAPAIHQELWQRYGEQGAPVELMKHYLLWDRDGVFNADAVDGFIANFRESLQFANLLSDDIVKDEDKPTEVDHKGEPSVKIGDLVQWTSGGSDMFPEPRQVLGISEDGEFAFVPGTDTGLPVAQLTVKSRAMNEPETTIQPPSNPFRNTSGNPSGGGPKEEVFELPSGRAALRYPDKIDSESVDELEEWLKLVVKKLRRLNPAEKK